MEIKHYCNSFITIKSNEFSIFCDPWIGLTNENSWLSYPITNIKNINKIKEKPNFIYISHLHCDHLDPKTIKAFFSKDTTIIIKEFKQKRLKQRLINLGFKKILECKPWKIYNICKDFKIVIIPQMSSNTSNLKEDINYDLDTSILIQSKKTKQLFFNSVDNPLSIKDIKKINSFVNQKFNTNINVACFFIGAASEYPHCFLNIDRKKEKLNIINKSVNRINSIISILKPNIFFQAGGTYIISGKFHSLNRYIAQPTQNQIVKKIKFKKTKVIDIEGGNSIFYSKNSWIKNKIINFNSSKDKKEIIKKFSKSKYFYQNKNLNNLKNLDKIFSKSLENYLFVLSKLKIQTSWKIFFKIYKDLKLNSSGNILKSKSNFMKEYEISYLNNSKNKIPQLTLHLDYELFYGLLIKKYIWNAPLSGSVILFERKPNYFDPNITFSLNFLNFSK